MHALNFDSHAATCMPTRHQSTVFVRTSEAGSLVRDLMSSAAMIESASRRGESRTSESDAGDVLQ